MARQILLQQQQQQQQLQPHQGTGLKSPKGSEKQPSLQVLQHTLIQYFMLTTCKRYCLLLHQSTVILLLPGCKPQDKHKRLDGCKSHLLSWTMESWTFLIFSIVHCVLFSFCHGWMYQATFINRKLREAEWVTVVGQPRLCVCVRGCGLQCECDQQHTSQTVTHELYYYVE